MKRSLDRILTTHVGSLPRPNDLVELYRNDAPESQLFPRLRSAIADVVRAQSSSGIDIVNDGEFGKAMRRSVDFGAWWSYVYDRLAGFDLREEAAKKGRAAWTFGSKERKEFAEFYAEEASAAQGGAVAAQGVQGATSSARMYGLTCTAPVKYTGQAIVQHDIENLKAALAGVGAEEAFMTAVSPATLQILPNEYYKSQEEYTWALAEAIHEEYKAIVDAGFILQIDDPALVDLWDWWYSLNGDMAGYRKWAAFRSKRRIMHCGASRKSACVSIFAGAAGTVRTAAICRSRTSWICCSRSRHRPILSRQGTSGTSTSGRCGRTLSCPTARF